MNSEKLIKEYQADKKAFDGKYKELIKHHLKNELDKLEQDEIAPVSSDNCDGNGIATGTYADAFNEIDYNGSILIYNNNKCVSSLAFGEDEDSIFNQPLEVQIETLLSLSYYNEEKQMTEQDFENLNVVKNNLDSNSELDKSLKKAIKLLKM